MTQPNPEIMTAVANTDLDTIVDAAVKFLRQRAEDAEKDEPGLYEDPVVEIGTILRAIGWQETQEMRMLVYRAMRTPHDELHDEGTR